LRSSSYLPDCGYRLFPVIPDRLVAHHVLLPSLRSYRCYAIYVPCPGFSPATTCPCRLLRLAPTAAHLWLRHPSSCLPLHATVPYGWRVGCVQRSRPALPVRILLFTAQRCVVLCHYLWLPVPVGSYTCAASGRIIHYGSWFTCRLQFTCYGFGAALRFTLLFYLAACLHTCTCLLVLHLPLRHGWFGSILVGFYWLPAVTHCCGCICGSPAFLHPTAPTLPTFPLLPAAAYPGRLFTAPYGLVLPATACTVLVHAVPQFWTVLVYIYLRITFPHCRFSTTFCAVTDRLPTRTAPCGRYWLPALPARFFRTTFTSLAFGLDCLHSRLIRSGLRPYLPDVLTVCTPCPAFTTRCRVLPTLPPGRLLRSHAYHRTPRTPRVHRSLPVGLQFVTSGVTRYRGLFERLSTLPRLVTGYYIPVPFIRFSSGYTWTDAYTAHTHLPYAPRATTRLPRLRALHYWLHRTLLPPPRGLDSTVRARLRALRLPACPVALHPTWFCLYLPDCLPVLFHTLPFTTTPFSYYGCAIPTRTFLPAAFTIPDWFTPLPHVCLPARFYLRLPVLLRSPRYPSSSCRWTWRRIIGYYFYRTRSCAARARAAYRSHLPAVYRGYLSGFWFWTVTLLHYRYGVLLPDLRLYTAVRYTTWFTCTGFYYGPLHHHPGLRTAVPPAHAGSLGSAMHYLFWTVLVAVHAVMPPLAASATPPAYLRTYLPVAYHTTHLSPASSLLFRCSGSLDSLVGSPATLPPHIPPLAWLVQFYAPRGSRTPATRARTRHIPLRACHYRACMDVGWFYMVAWHHLPPYHPAFRRYRSGLPFFPRLLPVLPTAALHAHLRCLRWTYLTAPPLPAYVGFLPPLPASRIRLLPTGWFAHFGYVPLPVSHRTGFWFFSYWTVHSTLPFGSVLTALVAAPLRSSNCCHARIPVLLLFTCYAPPHLRLPPARTHPVPHAFGSTTPHTACPHTLPDYLRFPDYCRTAVGSPTPHRARRGSYIYRQYLPPVCGCVPTTCLHTTYPLLRLHTPWDTRISPPHAVVDSCPLRTYFSPHLLSYTYRFTALDLDAHCTTDYRETLVHHPAHLRYRTPLVPTLGYSKFCSAVGGCDAHRYLPGYGLLPALALPRYHARTPRTRTARCRFTLCRAATFVDVSVLYTHACSSYYHTGCTVCRARFWTPACLPFLTLVIHGSHPSFTHFARILPRVHLHYTAYARTACYTTATHHPARCRVTAASRRAGFPALPCRTVTGRFCYHQRLTGAYLYHHTHALVLTFFWLFAYTHRTVPTFYRLTPTHGSFLVARTRLRVPLPARALPCVHGSLLPLRRTGSPFHFFGWLRCWLVYAQFNATCLLDSSPTYSSLYPDPLYLSLPLHVGRTRQLPAAQFWFSSTCCHRCARHPTTTHTFVAYLYTCLAYYIPHHACLFCTGSGRLDPTPTCAVPTAPATTHTDEFAVRTVPPSSSVLHAGSPGSAYLACQHTCYHGSCIAFLVACHYTIRLRAFAAAIRYTASATTAPVPVLRRLLHAPGSGSGVAWMGSFTHLFPPDLVRLPIHTHCGSRLDAFRLPVHRCCTCLYATPASYYRCRCSSARYNATAHYTAYHPHLTYHMRSLRYPVLTYLPYGSHAVPAALPPHCHTYATARLRLEFIIHRSAHYRVSSRLRGIAGSHCCLLVCRAFCAAPGSYPHTALVLFLWLPVPTATTHTYGVRFTTPTPHAAPPFTHCYWFILFTCCYTRVCLHLLLARSLPHLRFCVHSFSRFL